MNYEEYLEKFRSFVKNTTGWQRALAVLLLLAILTLATLLLNPRKKLLERRNSQRRSDVVNILNSVYQYSLDHGGELPANITNEPTMICKTKASSCAGLVDITSIIEDEKYLLSAVPVDPKEKNGNSSGYQIYKLSSGRINVAAPLAENNAVIKLSK